MHVENFSDGFTSIYHEGIIKKSVVTYENNRISFYYQSGKMISMCPPVPLSGFNAQFGIGVSLDGKYYFVQNWERNKVYCFRISDGRKKWAVRINQPQHLIVCHDFLICYSMENGIYKLTIQEGNMIQSIPYTTFGTFKNIGNQQFLIGPIQGNFQIWNFDFVNIGNIPISTINPTGYDTFIVTHATENEGVLVISGFEYWHEHMREADRNKTANQEIEKARFTKYLIKQDGGQYILTEPTDIDPEA